MEVALRGSGYAECWRGFNSHWHNDWRRKGDVAVWCLFPERKVREDHEAEKKKRQEAAGFWRNAMETKWMKDWAGMGKRTFGLLGKTEQRGDLEKHVNGKGPAVVTISRDHQGDSVLGGAKGPWGIGKSSRPERKEPATSRWWEVSLPWGGQRQAERKKRSVWS